MRVHPYSILLNRSLLLAKVYHILSSKPIIIPLKSVLLDVSSSRVTPRILLKPPLLVNLHSSMVFITPISIEDTFIGRKPVVRIGLTVFMQIEGHSTGKLYDVGKASLTFLHILKEDTGIMEFIGKPPSSLPKEVVEQLAGITINEAISLLVLLFDKHMLPLQLPVKWEVNIKLES